MQTYAFDFDPRFRRLLIAWGVTPDRASVSLDGGRLIARFGRVTVHTPVTNIKSVRITGPYHSWKAIGVRLSFADRGLTFGTNTRQGVCLTFAEPVSGVVPGGLIKHPGLTVTVVDPEAFAEAVRTTADIVG